MAGSDGIHFHLHSAPVPVLILWRVRDSLADLFELSEQARGGQARCGGRWLRNPPAIIES
jgi:hypothetical protein